jgi:hypothetical protein
MSMEWRTSTRSQTQGNACVEVAVAEIGGETH